VRRRTLRVVTLAAERQRAGGASRLLQLVPSASLDSDGADARFSQAMRKRHADRRLSGSSRSAQHDDAVERQRCGKPTAALPVRMVDYRLSARETLRDSRPRQVRSPPGDYWLKEETK
jgi:hypothetical protein